MRRWLERRDRLGLTFRELSLQTGVPGGTLACWAWKLRREIGHAQRIRGRRGKFVELVAEAAAAGCRVEIVLRGERRLIVDAEVDERALARIIAALERC